MGAHAQPQAVGTEVDRGEPHVYRLPAASVELPLAVGLGI